MSVSVRSAVRVSCSAVALALFSVICVMSSCRSLTDILTVALSIFSTCAYEVVGKSNESVNVIRSRESVKTFFDSLFDFDVVCFTCGVDCCFIFSYLLLFCLCLLCQVHNLGVLVAVPQVQGDYQ